MQLIDFHNNDDGLTYTFRLDKRIEKHQFERDGLSAEVIQKKYNSDVILQADNGNTLLFCTHIPNAKIIEEKQYGTT